MRKLPVFLCMALLMAGCGGNPAETSAPSETPEETTEEVDSDVIYSDNNLSIRFVDIDDNSSYPEIKLEFTNHNDQELIVAIDAIVLNDELAVDGYTYNTIPANETIEVSEILGMETLDNKGLSQIGKLQGYLTISDSEYNTLLEKELITIYEDPSVSVNHINSSGTIFYDQDGVSISYEGSMKIRSDVKQYIFLVSNDTSAFIDVSFDTDIFKVNGEYASEQQLNSPYITIPVGKKALVTTEITDGETYEPFAFESADLWLNIYDGNNPSLYIPIHMNAEEESVSVSAGEPYTEGELSEITYVSQNTDTFVEFLTFYYDPFYNRLEGIVDEAKSYKSAGYTKEFFESEEAKEALSIYDDLDFEETIMDETDTTIDVVWIFRDLAYPENLKQMHEIGYITLADPNNPSALNVEALFQLYEDAGMGKIDPSEYEEYHLHTDVY